MKTRAFQVEQATCIRHKNMWGHSSTLKYRVEEHFDEYETGDIGKGRFNGLMCHHKSLGLPTENNQETLVIWVWIGWCVRVPAGIPGSSVKN